MNRKIMLSGFSILTAVTLMGGSALAAFTTSATATGTTFSTTNPTLQVSTDNGSTFGPSKPGPTVTGLIPGTPGTAVHFQLKNVDTDTSYTMPASLQLNVGGGNTLPGGDLTIVVNCGGPDISHLYSDWLSTGFAIGTVPISGGGTLNCTMTPTLNGGVGNSDAGKSAIFDAVFTGSIGT